MKKRLLVLAAVGAAACCMVAGCSSGADEYGKLNDMLNASYSAMQISVKDTFDDGYELTSLYTLIYVPGGATVDYAVDRFQELSLDETSLNVITTLTGSALVQGDSVTFTGDDIGLTADITKVGLTFRKEYFVNVLLTNERFEAFVSDPSGFFGTQISCSDMTVSASFAKKFSYIKLNYTASGGDQVEICYYFTV